MKICTKCGVSKPLTEFYATSRNNPHLRSACKGCCNRQTIQRQKHPDVRAREREKHAALTPVQRDAHKERVREYHLKQKYGITNVERQKMLDMQDGLCGICGISDATHIDHRHTSGKVRMILCNQCNQLVGFAKENSHTLRAAADYVESYT